MLRRIGQIRVDVVHIFANFVPEIFLVTLIIIGINLGSTSRAFQQDLITLTMDSSGDITNPDHEIFCMVADLLDPEKREHSLYELSKRRERVPDLAIILWYSYGTITSLLNEIVSVYPLLSPPKLKVWPLRYVPCLFIPRVRNLIEFAMLLRFFNMLHRTKTLAFCF
jgi:hypothetical protein